MRTRLLLLRGVLFEARIAIRYKVFERIRGEWREEKPYGVGGSDGREKDELKSVSVRWREGVLAVGRESSNNSAATAALKSTGSLRNVSRKNKTKDRARESEAQDRVTNRRLRQWEGCTEPRRLCFFCWEGELACNVEKKKIKQQECRKRIKQQGVVAVGCVSGGWCGGGLLRKGWDACFGWSLAS